MSFWHFFGQISNKELLICKAVHKQLKLHFNPISNEQPKALVFQTSGGIQKLSESPTPFSKHKAEDRSMKNSGLSLVKLIVLWTALAFLVFNVAQGQTCRCRGYIRSQRIVGRNAGTKWASVALKIIEDLNTPITTLDVPPIARKLAVFSNCMYDAFCSRSGDCTPIIFSQFEAQKTAAAVNSAGIRRRASVEDQVSYAAFYALEKLFGRRHRQATRLLSRLGLSASDVNDSFGAFVCKEVIRIRDGDGSDMPGRFVPSNQASRRTNDAECSTFRNRGGWQPICVAPAREGRATFVQAGPNINSISATVRQAEPIGISGLRPVPLPGFMDSNQCNPQEFPSPQYADKVAPFTGSTLTVADNLGPPPKVGTTRFNKQFEEVLKVSGTLDDKKKVVSEFWDDNPQRTFPPGQWYRIALDAAVAKRLPLKNTVALLMTMGNGMLDAGIAAWRTKKEHDLVRPITVIQCGYENKELTAWSRPYRGVRTFFQNQANTWRPYLETPPFPGYVSGHSTFGGAGEAILEAWFGRDYVGPNCFTRRAGESKVEPRIVRGQAGHIRGVTDVPNRGPKTIGYSPARRVRLCWRTWREASDENGISRIYGGVHIKADNIFGILLGRLVGRRVHEKAREFTNLQGGRI